MPLSVVNQSNKSNIQHISNPTLSVTLPLSEYQHEYIPLNQISEPQSKESSIQPHTININLSAYATNNHDAYLQILYRCMLYVRKQDQRALIDDGILLQELSQHITISINPLPITTIGQFLLMDGYVLVSYSILMGRLNHSIACYNYLMSQFYTTSQMLVHADQFNYYYATLKQLHVLGLLMESQKYLKKSKKFQQNEIKLKRNRIITIV